MENKIEINTQNGKTLEIINNIDTQVVLFYKRKLLNERFDETDAAERFIGVTVLLSSIFWYIIPESEWFLKAMLSVVNVVLIACFFGFFFENKSAKKDIETFNAKYPSDEGEYDIEEIIRMTPADSSFYRTMIFLLKTLPNSKVIDYAIIKEKEHYELQFFTELPLSGDISTKSISIKPQFNVHIETIQITVFENGVNVKFPMEYMEMDRTVKEQNSET